MDPLVWNQEGRVGNGGSVALASGCYPRLQARLYPLGGQLPNGLTQSLLLIVRC
jgi:hypothetical protein